MLLAEPPQTQWDVNFPLFGIPIRVTPMFWLANALLGWSFAQNVAASTNLNAGLGLMMWIMIVLVSIIVHEIGHVIAFRRYGIASDVVLYQFGGLAVPRGSHGFGRQARLDSRGQIFVSAAGPAASLLLGLAIAAIVYVGGFAIPNFTPFKPELAYLTEGKDLHPTAWYLIDGLLFANIAWGLVNLLPVYPLDGGQISREVFLMTNYETGIRQSLILSILVAGGIALWAFSRHDTYLGLMFAILGFSSYQILQAYSGRGGFGGGW